MEFKGDLTCLVKTERYLLKIKSDLFTSCELFTRKLTWYRTGMSVDYRQAEIQYQVVENIHRLFQLPANSRNHR